MNLKLSIANYQLSILLILFFSLPVKAQVTIGSQKAPHSYSVLELMSAKGLRLPVLNNSERDALKLTPDSTEAGGLVIYNTDIDCVELFSNGSWIDLCSSALPLSQLTPTIISTLVPGSGTLSGRTFFDIVSTDGGASSCGTVADRAANKADFTTTATYDYIFTASATGTVQNVRYVIQDSEGVLQASQSLSGTLVLGTLANGTSAPALTLNFKTDLNSTSSVPLIVGRDRNSAAHVVINIIYNNGLADVKVIETLSIQDCACGNSVQTISGAWLTFMCYNLGAATTVQSLSPAQQAAYSTPADNYGDLYQWGRQADGHQVPNSATVAGPITTFDSNGQPTGDNVGKFITNATSPNDWRTPQLNTLWYNNGKTVNDPCPSGWRVPTMIEWGSIFRGTAIAGNPANAAVNTWTWNSSGTAGYLIKPSGSSEPTFFLPMTGRYRANNAAIATLSVGYYWTSSNYNTDGYTVAFRNDFISTADAYNRADGFNIRCVADK